MWQYHQHNIQKYHPSFILTVLFSQYQFFRNNSPQRFSLIIITPALKYIFSLSKRRSFYNRYLPLSSSLIFNLIVQVTLKLIQIILVSSVIRKHSISQQSLVPKNTSSFTNEITGKVKSVFSSIPSRFSKIKIIYKELKRFSVCNKKFFVVLKMVT